VEPTLPTSLIGILVFGIIMYFGFRYANGNWKVSESKKTEYLNWTNKYGKTIKKGIIIISIIYGISMMIQILSLI
jgi:TRAP-type C4-dicarboxylate transport system permease small subunit